MKPTGTGIQVASGGGTGSALGVIVVVFLPKFGVMLDATEASLLTAAFGTILALAFRYLPPPKPKP